MSGRRAITEAEIRRAAAAGRTLNVPRGAVVTPAAKDLAKQLGVALVKEGTDTRTRGRTEQQGTEAPGHRSAEAAKRERVVVAVGADHGGFALKTALLPVIAELGFEPLDLGTHSTEPVDYPDFAAAVAREVAEGRARWGIVVDGAGIGSGMVANKVRGVRAAPCHDVTTAHNAREHNDANVLTLGGGLVGVRLASEIVRVFLTTPFGGGRHEPRVAKINRLDQTRG